ncbi:MAG: helix-turn-helix domain-containing protein [Gammaproteobacteria bacterium]|nr:helix-turn-helix domain-containing protein [Gammaproteobacteria bacterium]
MIRSYTVSELEQMSGTTRRTISDYIAKGVLAGPSHRGRGARYPQKDLDVLTVLPRLRTLMKKEFPTLKEVSAFLSQLSVRDINKLANLPSEESFVAEMRRLRVRIALMSLLPYMAPERIDEELGRLTRGQIRGIDAGRTQIGAVLDIEALVQAEAHAAPAAAGGRIPTQYAVAEAAADALTTEDIHEAAAEQAEPQKATWTVGWLHEQDDPARAGESAATPKPVAGSDLADTTTDLEGLLAAAEETQPEMRAFVNKSVKGSGGNSAKSDSVEDRLSEIATRLEKLESLLDRA